ncbi:hypothetical protein KI387_027264, partial [Taxus chinensis]
WDDVAKSILMGGWTRLGVGTTPIVEVDLVVDVGIGVGRGLGTCGFQGNGKFFSVGEDDAEEATINGSSVKDLM